MKGEMLLLKVMRLLAITTMFSIPAAACKCVLKNDHDQKDLELSQSCCVVEETEGTWRNDDCLDSTIGKAERGKFNECCKGRRDYVSDCS
jgi:hypothetical protein